MKKINLFTVFILVLTIISCSKDPVLKSKAYTASAYNGSGISGTVTFKEKSDGSTTISVSLNGGTASKTFPMHIHNGSATAPGSVAIDLSAMSTSTGHIHKDMDVVNKYADMLLFDGVFVAHDHANASNYVVVKNIGKNE